MGMSMLNPYMAIISLSKSSDVFTVYSVSFFVDIPIITGVLTGTFLEVS